MCRKCGTPTTELRSGLCPSCYLSWYCGFEKKSKCECCGFGDRRMLVRRRLDGMNWTTLCGNCAVLVGKRNIELEQLREELHQPGDRRMSTRRTRGELRQGERRSPDDMREVTRGTPERRHTERRSG
ncbi:MAG: hypothetical protein GY847_11690 [Proteobacteria bacterium]|nr:hypothetical protein [Pseudomonadota bacterium]